MFSVSGSTFQMHFKNGNTLSVKFAQKREDYYYVEVTAWDKDGQMIMLGNSDSIPWNSADDLYEIIKRIG